MTETATRPELSEQETRAIDWLEAAASEYAHRLQAQQGSTTPARKIGVRAVGPSLNTAPAHIKRGTQIDQDIWRAENSEDEPDYDYDDGRYDDPGYPSAEEDRLEGLSQSFKDSADEVRYGVDAYLDPVDPEARQAIVDKYAPLGALRQEMLAQGKPDPLAVQLHTIESLNQ